LTLRCCFPEYRKDSSEQFTANINFGGLAIATCCHHLCQWNHYTSNHLVLCLRILCIVYIYKPLFDNFWLLANFFCDLVDKKFFLDLGMTKEEFHAVTWFTSWAVDANHDSDFPDTTDCVSHLQSM
jgi:tRNA:m4X modification enzyme